MKLKVHWLGLWMAVACHDQAVSTSSVSGMTGAGAGPAAVSGAATGGAPGAAVAPTRAVAGALGMTAGVSGRAPTQTSSNGAAGGGARSLSAGAPAAGASGAAAQGGSGAGVAGAAQGGSAAGVMAAAQGGRGASAMAAAASEGCAKGTARPAGGAVMRSDRIYSFPEAYDGMTPAPLLLALHAAGNPNTQLQKLTQGSRLETEFVRAFPKSAGNAWVYNSDVGKIEDVLRELLSEYCIDEHRIFATGHSSGAQMVVQMLCKGEQRFRAVAPVAASKYCAELSPIPALYIQGQMDAQRGGGNGEDVVRVFQAGNMCGNTSTPISTISSCTSTFDHKDVAPGCVSYDNCTVPTLWCSHNDNGYNNSDGRQHGWPCFASSAIADFFLSF